MVSVRRDLGRAGVFGASESGVVGWVTSLGPVCECVGLVWPRVTMISPLPQDLSSLLVECARNKILSRAGNIKLLNRLTKTCSSPRRVSSHSAAHTREGGGNAEQFKIPVWAGLRLRVILIAVML